MNETLLVNETLLTIILSILVVAALTIGYLIGYLIGCADGHESENAAQQPSVHQPDRADYKRGA